MKRLLALAVIAVAGGVAVSAQSNWVHVGQDLAATKYSTLDRINTGNVRNLQLAWTFRTGDKTGFFESTPLVVDGVVITAGGGGFLHSPVSDAVVAFRLP